MSKEPQPQSPADREILKQEIDDQLGQINEYKETVDQLKFENLDVFAKIENSSKMCQKKHSPIREDKLKPEFSPPDSQHNFFGNKNISKKFLNLH